MITTIATKYLKARKEHRCEWCGDKILPSQRYVDDFVKDGGVYHWKSCLRCNFIFNELVSSQYISSWDGTYTEDDFREGCRSFCSEFICKHCNEFDPHNSCDNYENCYDKVGMVLRCCSIAHELQDNSMPHNVITNPFTYKLRHRSETIKCYPGEEEL